MMKYPVYDNFMEPVPLNVFTTPDPEADMPLPVQIYRDLLHAIRHHRLPAGAQLPSSRSAAAGLGVSRTTINTAYDMLRAEGAVHVRPGAAPVIAALPASRGGAAPARDVRLSARADGFRDPRLHPRAGLLSPGEPDETLFPRDQWAMALRRAARRDLGPMGRYGFCWGAPELRDVLARRLAVDRGVRADPDQILITPGTQSSLMMASMVLADPGDVAALENPGYLGARRALEGAGLTVRPIPVDGAGADWSAATAAHGARLIYVSPSSHYPMGARLSLARRLDLVQAARRTGAVILEDDYDSEFLWRGREIAALQSHAPDGEVVFMGSVSKVLLPGLRLGWMVLPKGMVDAMRGAQRTMGALANIHAQIALAEMIETGQYRAQARRLAKAYGSRSAALSAALRARFGDALRVHDPDGGLQLCVEFPALRDDVAIVNRLAEHGFGPTPLSYYDLGGARRGMVIGLAGVTPDVTARFCDALSRAMAAGSSG